MLFSAYGPILELVAMKTQKMKGQAFVVFADLESAKTAMAGLQGRIVFGKDMVGWQTLVLGWQKNRFYSMQRRNQRSLLNWMVLGLNQVVRNFLSTVSNFQRREKGREEKSQERCGCRRCHCTIRTYGQRSNSQTSSCCWSRSPKQSSVRSKSPRKHHRRTTLSNLFWISWIQGRHSFLKLLLSNL